MAKVSPGIPFSFLPQGAAAANSYDATGCVLQKNGAAIITDESGSQVAELRGYDLRKAIGKRTRVWGSVDATATPAGGASQVVKVSRATFDPKGASCSALATKLAASTATAGLAAGVGAGAAGAGAAAAGVAGVAAVGIGTTAAVVGGVAAATAATVGGLAAAGTILTPSP